MDQRDTQPGPPSYAPPQRTPNKPTVRRRTAIIGSAGGLVLGLIIGAAGHGTSKTTNTATGTPSATTTVTATVTVQNAAPAVAHTSAVPPPSTTAAPKPAVVFTTTGDGIKKTESFTTGPDWSVAYTFDCSNAGGQGNFVLQVDGDLGDMLANALSAKGADTSYEHDAAGSHYLSVNSECDWTLKVTNGG